MYVTWEWESSCTNRAFHVLQESGDRVKNVRLSPAQPI